MKGQLTATQFNKEQHKILKELFQDIKISLVQKLNKAIASGAIPDEWKQEGDYRTVKAVITSFCLDLPYDGSLDNTKKDMRNLHKFL